MKMTARRAWLLTEASRGRVLHQPARRTSPQPSGLGVFRSWNTAGRAVPAVDYVDTRGTPTVTAEVRRMTNADWLAPPRPAERVPDGTHLPGNAYRLTDAGRAALDAWKANQ